MKHLIIILLALYSVDGQAQTPWVEQGQDVRFWREVEGAVFNHTGCDLWTYSMDTSIANQNYQVLDGVFEYYDIIGGDTIGYDQVDRGQIILRTEGFQTWLFQDNEEILLADFGAVVGDQWSIPVEQPSSGVSVPDMLLTVDSIGESDFNGSTRLIMYYQYFFDFGAGCAESGAGYVVDGLFHRMDLSSEFILPVLPDLVCTQDANDLYYFTEFNSDGSPNYSETTPSNATCSSIETGLSEMVLNQVVLFPNPATDYVRIDHHSVNALMFIEILDSSGCVVIELPIDNRIDVSKLEAGIYLMRILDNKGVVLAEKLIVE